MCFTCGPQANLPSPARAKFVFGDWGDVEALLVRTGETFDVVLTSETIYSPASHAKLASLLLRALRPGGVCLLAAKRFYFGVGGGTRAFLAVAEAAGLRCEVAEVIEDRASNLRELCVLTRPA